VAVQEEEVVDDDDDDGLEALPDTVIVHACRCT
jgi:hypothetical protein